MNSLIILNRTIGSKSLKAQMQSSKTTYNFEQKPMNQHQNHEISYKSLFVSATPWKFQTDLDIFFPKPFYFLCYYVHYREYGI